MRKNQAYTPKSASSNQFISSLDSQIPEEIPHQKSKNPSVLSTHRTQDTVSSQQIDDLKKNIIQQSQKKSKQIHKSSKIKQVQNSKGKEEKEVTKFYRIKRRIVPPKVHFFFAWRIQAFFFVFFKIIQKNVFSKTTTNIDFLSIVDWEMEVCANIHMSKDAFYSALSMTKQIFNANMLNLLSQKVVTIQTIAIIAIAAKGDDGSMNYTELLASMCYIDKEEIVAAELCVSKKLQFNYHFRQVYSVIWQICQKWGKFITKRKSQLNQNFDALNLQIGDEQSQESCVRDKIEDIFYFFDAILIRCPTIFDLTNSEDLQDAASIAVFTVMNYLVKGFFPMSSTDKSYLLMIFHVFLTHQYQKSRTQHQKWMEKLITVARSLNIVENSHLYFCDRSLAKQKQQKNTSFIARNSVPLYKQVYHCSIRKWK